MFSTVFVIFLIFTLLLLLLYKIGFIETNISTHHAPFLVFAAGSLLLGSVIAIYVGKIIIRPIQNIGDAFDELSKGNFDVKVNEEEKLMEIREMAQRFNAMTYELSHIETIRNDFVANVSHEFKTPLSAIEGYATLLQNHNLSSKKHEHYVNKILENSRQLSNLSGNILLLSKLENQVIVTNKTQYRLDEQIRRCILNLENKWSKKNIEFDIEIPKCYFYGNEPLLEQVWLNIIDNAIKHSLIDGSICVTICEKNEKISVSISDNGDGMSEEVKKHIFEKFYQGDLSRTTEGNGLGLALVKRIVDLCGGEIEVISSPSKGADFIVKLPKENF